MNSITLPIRSSAMAAVLWAALLSPTIAQVSLTNFKAGAYRGTLQVTASVPDLGETKTTVKIVGRSTGDSTLRFVAPPQIAQPILSATDDFPVKFFSLTSIASFMVLREVNNVDNTSGSSIDRSLQTLTVNGGTVFAEETHTVTIGTNTATVSTRVRLRRTGN